MAADWYRFESHGRVEVMLFELDGEPGRAGARSTRFFRGQLATGADAEQLIREAVRRMPEVRRRWPDWRRPYGLKAGEVEVVLPALWLATGLSLEDVERLTERELKADKQMIMRRVEVVSPERRVTPKFDVNPASQREGYRREAQLVEDFVHHLREQGVNPRRLALPLEGSKLYNDLFVPERNQIIEAKGGTDRDYVRMAIGQLLDYAFQISLDDQFGTNAPEKAILFPDRPGASIMDLLDSLDIASVWRDADAFDDNRDGKFV